MSSDQMPAPGKIKLIKFPPPGQEKTSNARGMPEGGCWSFDLTDTLVDVSFEYLSFLNKQSSHVCAIAYYVSWLS